MQATEFIRVKRTKEEILSFLRDPALPERILRILEKQYGITIGLTGTIAGQSVASAIDELLGLTTNLQYSDVDVFHVIPDSSIFSHASHSEMVLKNVHLLDRLFAIKHYHMWLQEKFPHLNNAQMELAKTDMQLRIEFAKDINHPRVKAAAKAVYAIAFINPVHRLRASMSGLLVVEEESCFDADLTTARPEREATIYPKAFQASMDFVATASYTVAGIQTVGPQQFIHCTVSSPDIDERVIPSAWVDGYGIISGFDLNSVSVGIDVRSNKLLFTPAYVEFLLNRQIHIVNSSTPVQSVVRAMQKSQQHAGFFNTAHNLELMRHALLFAGAEPLGLNMPQNYEPGTMYRVYVEYQRAKLAWSAADPNATPRISLSQAISNFKTEFEKYCTYGVQQHRVVRLAKRLFKGKEICGIHTTTERFNKLNDENKALLESIVDMHSDPTGFYVFPQVKNFENIQYDCLAFPQQYLGNYDEEGTLPSLAELGSLHCSLWHNLEWGFKFKKMRPLQRQRIIKMRTALDKLMSDDELKTAGLKTGFYSQEADLFDDSLASIMYGSGLSFMYHTMKGTLPEQVVRMMEVPTKMYGAIGTQFRHPIALTGIYEHLFTPSPNAITTVESYIEFSQAVSKIVARFGADVAVYHKAGDVLEVPKHKRPNATSVFPSIQAIWENTRDAEGTSIARRVQEYYESNATQPGLLNFDGFSINEQNCLPFFDRKVQFDLYVRQYPTGWGVLEKFIEVWLGIGFTALIRQASGSLSAALKTTTIDFSSKYAQEVIHQWETSLRETEGIWVKDLLVEEIITAEDLIMEGQQMNHCVGGYASRVSGKQSFIIRYSVKKATRSTLENFMGPVPLVYEQKRATAEWYDPDSIPAQQVVAYDALTQEDNEEDITLHTVPPRAAYKLSQIRDVRNQVPDPILKALDAVLRKVGLPDIEVDVSTRVDKMVSKIQNAMEQEQHPQ